MNDMIRFLRLSALFCLFFIAAPGAAQETTPLEGLSTEAYLSLMDGDQLLEAGNPEAALEKYLESRQRYQLIRQQDPEFKRRVVGYRLEVLEEKIAALRPEPTPAPATATTIPERDFPEPTKPEDFQNLYLQARKQLAEETARIALLEARMIEADQLVREARTRLAEQSQELNQTRQELLALQEDTGGKMAALQEEARDFARFNELLKERADTVEAENAELIQERGRLAGQVADQQAALENLQQEVQKVTMELNARKRDASQSEQRLILERNQLRDDLEEARRKLEVSRTSLEETQEQVAEMNLLEESVIELNTRNELQATEIENLRSELNASTNQVADLKVIISGLREQIDPVKAEMEKWKASGSQAQEKAAALQTEVQSLQEERADSQRQIAQLQKRLGDAALSNEEKDALIPQLQQQLTGMREDLEQAQKDLEKSRKVEQKARDLIETVEQERREFRGRMRKLQDANQELKNLQEEQSTSSRKLEALQTERDRLELNLQQEQESRRQLKKTVDQQLDAITDRMNEIISLRVQLASAQKKIEALEAAEE